LIALKVSLRADMTHSVDPDDRTRVGAAELFRLEAAFVARILGRLGLRGPDLDDAVQDVFLTAHRRGGFVPDRAKARTWLAEIAVRVASNLRRAGRRRPTNVGDDALRGVATERADPFEATVHAERIERVAAALDTLSVAQRIVFVLSEIEGESCESIARGLGVPIGTVHSRVHVARRAFRRAYEAFDPPSRSADLCATALEGRTARVLP
jgi:RNA polymerase sigma-70 factor (ECF subfamily)